MVTPLSFINQCQYPNNAAFSTFSMPLSAANPMSVVIYLDSHNSPSRTQLCILCPTRLYMLCVVLRGLLRSCSTTWHCLQA